MGCVVYGVQLGWGAWLWVSMFDPEEIYLTISLSKHKGDDTSEILLCILFLYKVLNLTLFVKTLMIG